MDHLSHAAAAASGTLPGHLLPGLLFLMCGIWWAAEALWRRNHGAMAEALETSRALPLIKLAAFAVGTWFELPGRGWGPMSQVMGWSHIAIYAGFGISGAVDLLARAGRLPYPATYAAFAGASLNAAFLLATHGNHIGVETTAHRLLALAFAVAGAAALGEATRRSRALLWVRVGALITLGAWWLVTAWLLFLSGWDLADPVRELWVYSLFSWTAMATAAALIYAAALVPVHAAQAREGFVDAAHPIRSAPAPAGTADSGPGPH